MERISKEKWVEAYTCLAQACVAYVTMDNNKCSIAGIAGIAIEMNLTLIRHVQVDTTFQTCNSLLLRIKNCEGIKCRIWLLHALHLSLCAESYVRI